MKKNYIFKFSLSLALYFSAFSLFAQTTFTNGVLMLNEGASGSDSATISFLPQEGGPVQNDIYGLANSGGTLGDTGQSLSFYGDKAYVILNLSTRLRVVNSTTFELETTLETGLTNPRYMAFANGKGYITCWGGSNVNPYVAVFNLETNTIESTIPVAPGIERIMEINGKLYAAHKGGFGYGTTISVIDPVTNTVETTITVGDVPNTMVVDNGFLYVMCEGRPSWGSPETYGKLVKINLADNTVASTLDFPSLHPTNLKLANGNFYYSVYENIYKMEMTATTLPTAPLFSLASPQLYGIYGMDIIDEVLYVTEVTGFTVPAKANLYSLDGDLIESYTVGMSTNGYYKAVESDLNRDDNNKIEVALYPNPVSDVFFINTNESAKVTLYDISGRLVRTENYTVSGINISDLKTGIYVAEITIGATKGFKKIIKK